MVFYSFYSRFNFYYLFLYTNSAYGLNENTINHLLSYGTLDK